MCSDFVLFCLFCLWKVFQDSILGAYSKAIPSKEIQFVNIGCHMHILPFCSVFVFSPIFSSGLSSVFSKWDLPIFTLPFNMALTMYLSATGHYNPFFPIKLFKPITSVPNVTWSDLSGLQVRYTISSHSPWLWKTAIILLVTLPWLPSLLPVFILLAKTFVLLQSFGL